MTENKEEINIFRLTEEDRRKIHEKMDGFGIQNMSAYIRKMTLNGYMIVPQWPDLKVALDFQSRISNNLNQYAKKANESGNVYGEDIAEIKKMHVELTEVLGKALESVIYLYDEKR